MLVSWVGNKNGFCLVVTIDEWQVWELDVGADWVMPYCAETTWYWSSKGWSVD